MFSITVVAGAATERVWDQGSNTRNTERKHPLSTIPLDKAVYVYHKMPYIIFRNPLQFWAKRIVFYSVLGSVANNLDVTETKAADNH